MTLLGIIVAFVLIGFSYFLVLKKYIEEKRLFKLLIGSVVIGFFFANFDLVRHIKVPGLEIETYRKEIRKEVNTARQIRRDVLQTKEEVLQLQRNMELSAKMIAENQYFWVRTSNILPPPKEVQELIVSNLNEFARLAYPDDASRKQWIARMNAKIDEIVGKK